MTTNNFKNILKRFKPMTLTELNATASYLKRIDTKFLLTIEQLEEILHELEEDFQVLEIAKNRIFTYDNVYMDTHDYFFYNQHQQQEPSRTKIRTRLYQESDLAFFEYKQKENGITKKFRYQFPSDEHGIMTKGKQRFFEGVWQSIYEGQKKLDISPSIKTRYKRITLVSKTGDERLTIDFDINTSNLRDKNADETHLKNLVIIESKTLSKDCKSLKIMEKYGHKKSKSCSKYALGIIYAGLTNKFDTFQQTVNKIKVIRLEILKTRFRKTELKNLIDTTNIRIFRKNGVKQVIKK